MDVLFHRYIVCDSHLGEPSSTKLSLLARGKLNKAPAVSIVGQSSSATASATKGGNKGIIKPARLNNVNGPSTSKTNIQGPNDNCQNRRTWGQIVEDSTRKSSMGKKTDNKQMSDPDIPKFFTKKYSKSSVKDMCTLAVQTCKEKAKDSSEEEARDRLPLTDSEEKLFKALRNAQEKLMRYRLHKEYLGQYLSEGLVPKGLKLQAEPFLGKPDQTLDHEWAEILCAASSRLLEITIDKVELSIKDLDTQWQSIVDQIDRCNSQSSTKEL